MKTYKTPVLTGSDFSWFETDNEKQSALGAFPFKSIVNPVAAVAIGPTLAVTNAKQSYNDVYFDSKIINYLDEIE